MNGPFKQRRARIGTLTIIFGAVFVLVAIKLTMLVMLDGPRLASMAKSEHIGTIKLSAGRGPIFDRNGKTLALSAETFSFYAHPRRVLETSTPAERTLLAGALDLAPQELEERLKRKSSFLWLARQTTPQLARDLGELALEGVERVPEYHRFYPEGGLAAAVVGMAGMDGQGLSGVELEYDHIVRGEPVAVSFYRDAMRHPILDSPLELKDAQPGARLELTIDAAIQTQAENYLDAELKTSGARRGTAVVLEPFSGEVLAMANVDADHRANADRLHNAAIQDAFEPGSTMKGLLAGIALDRRAIDLNRRIYCERGAWHFAGKIIHDDGPHEWLNLGGIIEVSSNIGAAKIALSLGANNFAKGLEAFGLGAKTGIDLPGEASGLMRNPAKWRPIELADHGFGQGIAVTPIQLASAYAAIANGGVVMRPYVVKAAYDANGREIFEHTPQVLRRALAPSTAHAINNLLRGVVNSPDGTGRLAQVADFTVAGKTGTAQMVNPATGAYYQNRLVASFVGFVPAQDPRLVILVVLYDVPDRHFGGLYAAPVFSEIASHALNHLEVAPQHPTYDTASLLPFMASSDDVPPPEQKELSEPVSSDSPENISALSGRMPDFTGLSLRSALSLARAYGLNPQIEGTGYVVRQGPRAGSRNRGIVRLELAGITDTTEIENFSNSNKRHSINTPALAAREVRHPRNLQ